MDKKILTTLKRIIVSFWFESEQACLLCSRKSYESVCAECREEYFQPEVKRCYSCGKIIAGSTHQCGDCRAGRGPVGLSKVITLGHYQGLWKEYIHKIKYQGQPYLLIPLAETLSSWAIKELPPPDRLVPIPMHSQKIAERGFNQAEALASIIGRHMGLSCDEILERVVNTVPQAQLGRQDRLKNLKGAFRSKIEYDVKNQVIWLVDDVVTTGTTIGECANVLLEQGAKAVYAVCLGAGKEERNQ